MENWFLYTYKSLKFYDWKGKKSENGKRLTAHVGKFSESVGVHLGAQTEKSSDHRRTPGHLSLFLSLEGGVVVVGFARQSSGLLCSGVLVSEKLEMWKSTETGMKIGAWLLNMRKKSYNETRREKYYVKFFFFFLRLLWIGGTNYFVGLVV